MKKKDAPIDASKNIVEIMLQHASNMPDKMAYTFLANGHSEEASLTYNQLNINAQTIASTLRSQSVPGDKALLLYPQGLDFISAFIGCLYAGIIAIPTPAPETGRLKRSLPRLQAIIDDAGATLLLSNNHIIQSLDIEHTDKEYLNNIRKIDTTKLSHKLFGTVDHNKEMVPKIAYLQYTSGSTSSPKGVMITHDNITRHLRAIQTSCGYNQNSVSVSWMPHYHDYGLVEGILLPLYNGTPCYIMSPFAFVKKPAYWLKAISKYKASHSQAPNFAYERCLLKVSPNEQEQLDLSSWISAANAAEAINPKVLLNFAERFSVNGFSLSAFSPGYGLAENTLVASILSVGVMPVITDFDSKAIGQGKIQLCSSDAKYSVSLVGCGKPIADTEIVIVDPDTCQPCSADEIGEIWIHSPGVAAGYWQQSDESIAILEARISSDTGSRVSDKTYLRTGDLGFFYDGQLYIADRLKDMIIVDGINYFPHDLEWTVEQSHPSIKSGGNCTAFSVTHDSKEKLIVTIEVLRNSPDYNDIWSSVTQAISEYHDLKLFQLVILKSGATPKTSSGKVQRRQCKNMLLDGSLPLLWTKIRQEFTANASSNNSSGQDILKDANTFEQWLATEAAIILKTAVTSIDVSSPISRLGFDSLDTLTWVTLIEEKIGQKLPLAEVVGDGRTIRQLSEMLINGNWQPLFSSLVPIQTNGIKPPLFCVHPAGGNVLGYSALSQHLGPSQPVYGLQSLGLVESQEPLSSFEEMATHYIKEIKQIQPTEPYYLCGMCLGGIIAYEMAQQLIKNDEQVAFLGLIDPRNPPTLLKAFAAPDLYPDIDSQLLAVDRTNELQLLKTEAEGKQAITFPDNIVPKDPVLRRVFDSNLKARDIYIPKPYYGHVTFIWANQTPGDLGFYHDPRVCWTSLAKNSIDIHPISANHFELLNEPYVRELAQVLNSKMERAQSTRKADVHLP